MSRVAVAEGVELVTALASSFTALARALRGPDHQLWAFRLGRPNRIVQNQ